MSSQRDISIDIAKGICIFLMVMGHADVPESVFKWIYSFHMPFFFMASGMFFNPSKYTTWKSLLLARGKTLLIPYFSLSIIVAGLYCLVGEVNFKAMFTGWGGIALWFIPVLFVSELVFYLIWKVVGSCEHSKVYAMVCSVIVLLGGYGLSKTHTHWLLQLDVVGMGCFFYSVGYLLRHMLKTITLKWWWTGGLMIIYFIAIQALRTLDMCPNSFGTFPISQIMAIVGSVLVIICARIVASWNINNPFRWFFNWAGKNTLVVVGFSQVIIALLNFYGSEYIGVVFSIIKYVGIWGILYVISLILSRYLPFVVGK